MCYNSHFITCYYVHLCHRLCYQCLAFAVPNHPSPWANFVFVLTVPADQTCKLPPPLVGGRGKESHT